MNVLSNFASFMKKPMLCKCGHPNRPSHRSGHWYDATTRCVECDCAFFVPRNESGKLNKVLDITAILGISLVCVFAIGFIVNLLTIINTNGDIASQNVVINKRDFLGWIALGFAIFTTWLCGFVFDMITRYMRVHRKEIKTVGERWKEYES